MNTAATINPNYGRSEFCLTKFPADGDDPVSRLLDNFFAIAKVVAITCGEPRIGIGGIFAKCTFRDQVPKISLTPELSFTRFLHQTNRLTSSH